MRKNGGFTLVELIVVIAILAILAGVAVPAYSGYIKKANEAADNQLLAAINTSFAAARVENGLKLTDVPAASLQIGQNGAVNVASLKPAALQEAFGRYYAGNEGAIFKVFTVLSYDASTGNFVGGAMSDRYNNLMQNIIQSQGTNIGLIQDSAFMGIGSAALLGQVNDVSNTHASYKWWISGIFNHKTA